ncbi:MAG: sensor histidine kinase, partial [Pseudomonadales bacterium]
LVSHTEHLLAGVIGAASARVMVSTLFKGQTLDIEDVMDILDETSQVMEYSHRLEHKTEELEAVGKELRAANERLQELDRLKDDFVSTVSHELRTPLTSIRAFSEILLSEPELELEQRQNFLQIVVNETERLTRLTNDVLDLAKIESGRMDWNMQPTDVRQVIKDAISSVFQLYEERGIGLQKDLCNESAEASIDRDRILQVIINLLSNAAKFCEQDQGQVRISLTNEGDELRICVADNGPGIELKHHATLFDKFQQVSDQQQGKPKGSGLGLAICKLIVEHHGGRIWLESEPGGGSRFFFALKPA